MKIPRKIGIHDRLEVFHLEAYFGVRAKKARQYKKDIMEGIKNRKSGIFAWDLAEYDGFDPRKEESRIRFLDCLNECFDIENKEDKKKVG